MAAAYQHGLEQPDKAIEYSLRGIEIDPFYWGDPQSALREFEIWMGVLKRIRPLNAARGRPIYVRFLAENGMMDEAEGVAEQLKRDIERLDPERMDYYWAAMSFIERAKGNRRAAATHMRRAVETGS